MRAEDNRVALKKLVHQRPFVPFLISLDNGERFLIEHPENVAFDPNDNGWTRFSVIARDLIGLASLESVSAIIHQDTGTIVGA